MGLLRLQTITCGVLESYIERLIAPDEVLFTFKRSTKEKPEAHYLTALPKARDCDISFTPGFSPVSNDDKKRETVLTVSSCGHNTEAVEYVGATSTEVHETVETVS